MNRYISKPLSNHQSAKCEVRAYSDGTMCLVSYTTTVARVERDPYNDQVCYITPMGQYWDDRVYTKTTARQISWFLNEYVVGIGYYQFKKAAENGETLSAHLKKFFQYE